MIFFKNNEYFLFEKITYYHSLLFFRQKKWLIWIGLIFFCSNTSFAIEEGNMMYMNCSWCCFILCFCVSIILFLLILIGYLKKRFYRQEKLLHSLLVVPIQMGICDEKGKIFYYQDGKYDINKKRPVSLSELPVEIQQEFQKVLPKIFEKNENQSIEFDVFNKRHKVDFFYQKKNHWSSHAVVVWISHDVTTLYQVCQEKERGVERFKQTLASIGEAVVVTNYDGEINIMNSEAEKLSRISIEEAKNKKINECFHTLTSDLLLEVEKVIHNGEEYVIETFLQLKDGEIFIEGKISPIKEKESFIVGAVLCFRDVTERIRLHEQEKKVMTIAQIAERTKSDLIAVMNHEFRSSLNTINGYCELLRMSADNEVISHVIRIQRECFKLFDDMSNLLDFSISDFNNIEVTKTPTILKDLLCEIQHIFLRTVNTRNSSLKVEIPEVLPVFLSDYKIIRQILIGFLAQAFSSSVIEQVVLSVNWKAPQLEIIIKIFTKQKSTLNIETSDTTLVNQQLLQLLNGTFTFENKENYGVLSIIFPDIECLSNKNTVMKPIKHISGTSYKDVVILIDDIPVNLKVLSLMLKKLNIESVSCNSVKEALEELEQYTPRAILTDLWMSECNGDELALLLKKSPETADIPVVLVTADNQIDEQTKKIFSHTIVKPLSIEELKTIMDLISLC